MRFYAGFDCIINDNGIAAATRGNNDQFDIVCPFIKYMSGVCLGRRTSIAKIPEITGYRVG